jgi:hypothetical protein
MASLVRSRSGKTYLPLRVHRPDVDRLLSAMRSRSCRHASVSDDKSP